MPKLHNVDIHAIGIPFDGDGQSLVAGKTAYYAMPFGCTIYSWDMTVDSGTASIDVWKVNNISYLPRSTNKITGDNAPAISSGQHVYGTNLTGWSRAVYPHDVFGFYLRYVTIATQASLVLRCN